MHKLKETLSGQQKSSEQRLTDMEQRLAKIEELLRPPPASEGPSKTDQILDLVTMIADGMDFLVKEIKQPRK